MGTKKGQKRKTARRAYEGKMKIRKPRKIDFWSRPPRLTKRDKYMSWVRDNFFFRKRR